MTSHLLIFQQDEAHDGDMNGVPDAGVVKQASHLCKRVREGIRPQPGYRIWNPVPTPAIQEACTSDHTQDRSQGHTNGSHYCGYIYICACPTSYLHISTPAHPHTAHLHTCTSPHLHVSTPARLHTYPSPHLHISTPARLHTCPTPHLHVSTAAHLYT